MSAPLADNEFTPEQQAEFEKHFSYNDTAEISAEEWALAKEIFDTPEKFKLLRKVLQIFTPEERGLTYVERDSLIERDTDLARYGLEVMISKLADDRIRSSLLSFYHNLRQHKVADLKAEKRKENEEAFEDEKKKEELEQSRDQEKKRFGDNL